MWCETAPCAKETKALAIVEDFLVPGVSGLVAGFIGTEGADCWSCSGYAYCHCAERQEFYDRWSVSSDEKCNF
jgi:hypothetical protein